jgi:hypothetical protein
LAGSFIGSHQHDRPARLARIATPENAEPVAFCSRLGTLDTADVSGQVCSNQPIPLHRSRATVPKAGRSTTHPSRFTGLAESVQRRAARHLAVRPIAEPRATDHEIVPLFRGAESRDATGSWVSPTSE